jgi:hypothetical protein
VTRTVHYCVYGDLDDSAYPYTLCITIGPNLRHFLNFCMNDQLALDGYSCKGYLVRQSTIIYPKDRPEKKKKLREIFFCKANWVRQISGDLPKVCADVTTSAQTPLARGSGKLFNKRIES